MLYSIDRFEGDVAVLVDERETVFNVPRAQLPDGVRVGDMLRIEDGQYSRADDETQARREQVLRLQNKLRQK